MELDYTPVMVAISECHHPGWNPGTRHLDESLAPSIREVGLQQPVLLRPIVRGKRAAYEIVAGNRRVAGARAAGLSEIPAFVRALSEPEAIKLCGVENLQRKDLDPLEEADWLKAYAELDGNDVESTALTFGRTVDYVRERINLSSNLEASWRSAHAGRGNYARSHVREWRFSHLAQVAKLGASSQKSLLKAILEREEDELGVPTNAQLRELIQLQTMVLSAAPWKHADESLVRGKPCTGCPSRSDAQGNLELWAEMDAATHTKARCLDRACWDRKMERWVSQRIEKVKAEHGDDLRAFGRYVFGVPDETFHGIRTVSQWRGWGQCEESAPGAVPALDVRDPAAAGYLRLVWVRDLRSRNAEHRGGDRPKRTLEEKRTELEGRRALALADAVLDEIVPPSARPEGSVNYDAAAAEEGEEAPAPAVPKLADPYAVIALALVFGTHQRWDGSWMYRNPVAAWALDWPDDNHGRHLPDPWEVLDVCTKFFEEDLLEKLWELQVLPVIVGRLAQRHLGRPEDRVALKAEAERFCRLVGIDPEPLWQRVLEAKPEPKAWAKQEAAAAASKPAKKKRGRKKGEAAP